MLYATSSYLMALLKPWFEVRVVPGVTAMCAAAAELCVPLCEDRETLTILPGFEEGRALPDGSAVIMKAGGHRGKSSPPERAGRCIWRAASAWRARMRDRF